jgi:hypothetical protein
MEQCVLLAEEGVKIPKKNVKGVPHNMAYNIPHGFFALH